MTSGRELLAKLYFSGNLIAGLERFFTNHGEQGFLDFLAHRSLDTKAHGSFFWVVLVQDTSDV